MLGLAAAPEIAIAVPRVMPPAVLGRRPVAEVAAAAVQRRDRERRGLALLPGEPAAADQVEGEVQHVKRLPLRVELVHRDVVVGGEAGEPAGSPRAVRGARGRRGPGGRDTCRAARRC